MEGSLCGGVRPAPGPQRGAHQELPVAIKDPHGGSPERNWSAAAGAATATKGAATKSCPATGSGIAATAAAGAK